MSLNTSELTIDCRNPGPAKDALIKSACDELKNKKFATIKDANEIISTLDAALADVDAKVAAWQDAQKDIAKEEKRMGTCDGEAK